MAVEEAKEGQEAGEEMVALVETVPMAIMHLELVRTVAEVATVDRVMRVVRVAAAEKKVVATGESWAAGLEGFLVETTFLPAMQEVLPACLHGNTLMLGELGECAHSAPQ